MTYPNALRLHKSLKGKIEIISKFRVNSKKELSLVYTPYVADVCKKIYSDKHSLFNYTIKNNSLAVISDGSAVLGLGNLGAESVIPVLEGKCLLFKYLAGIDAFPIALATQKKEEIVSIIRNIAPVFGAVNLEDIAAPNCFYIENSLQDLGIAVMHDDQHCTAIVLLAALINALTVANKDFSDSTIVINGIGAAGTAITRLLLSYKKNLNLILCDKQGILNYNNTKLQHQIELLKMINNNYLEGDLSVALKDADVFIGVSAPNIVTEAMIKSMGEKPIVFALANPVPEIMPARALKAGAYIVATGRSDFKNQINNVLAFPSVFRAALDIRAKSITKEMKLSAAIALANMIKPTRTKILPNVLDKNIVPIVSSAVKKAALKKKVILC